MFLSILWLQDLKGSTGTLFVLLCRAMEEIAAATGREWHPEEVVLQDEAQRDYAMVSSFTLWLFSMFGRGA